MGLSIEVGFLADMLSADEEGAQWFRGELIRLNSFLQSSGLSAHVEPEQCPIWSADMLGYSGLHCLRRLAAHIDLRGSLPEPGGNDSADDRTLNRYYKLWDDRTPTFVARMLGKPKKVGHYDHLIHHSDAEGFYVPQDFPEVLFPPEDLRIPGGMVGSSIRLLDEVQRLAAILELPLDMDEEHDALWEAAESQGEGELRWQRYGVESFICLRLYRAAESSIKHSSLIVFC